MEIGDIGNIGHKRGLLFRELWDGIVAAILESQPSSEATGESKRKKEGLG